MIQNRGFDMVKAISILGSTGSIGRQTVAVAEHLHLKVSALTTNKKLTYWKSRLAVCTRSSPSPMTRARRRH